MYIYIYVKNLISCRKDKGRSKLMEAPLKDRRGREGCGHPVPAVEMSLSLVKSTLTRKQKRIFFNSIELTVSFIGSIGYYLTRKL